ncbi:MAG: Methyltransferase FkbM [Gammaproteobacteria bacterium]|nr:Methyltransferase FkbM [Gammaproteobacteria bacterium]
MSTYFSQFGEDQILAEIFGERRNGTCVEVGANDGVHGSTTYFFEKLGWRCILVEPNPGLCAEIRAVRAATLFECAASNSRGTVTLHVVEGAWRADGMSTISNKEEDQERIRRHGFTSTAVPVPTMTLDEILTSANLDGAIDFISIDVEGHEEEVIEGFSLQRWQPRIVIVEDNSNAESNATRDQLAKQGYVRFRRTGVNDWYARASDRRLVTVRARISVGSGLLALRIQGRLRKIPLLRRIRNLLRGHPVAP